MNSSHAPEFLREARFGLISAVNTRQRAAARGHYSEGRQDYRSVAIYGEKPAAAAKLMGVLHIMHGQNPAVCDEIALAALKNYGDNNSDNDDSHPAKSRRKEHPLFHGLWANGTHDAFSGRIAGLRAIYRALVAFSTAWRTTRRVLVAS
ncbi:hypothetical protein CSOJ01_06565 [Colletotrichum sojae]|uniref:Uncharacterized protein n=1 Tax=Colletotrichum sojae TaxID=2175907 RepID=A0A8H6JBK1_9PEZI|nr:hypothetical protein CSOJ01_06565 [Colletotrichum sojae]